jgi:act minimal PKS chain-length factor (CLF/KS beta)
VTEQPRVVVTGAGVIAPSGRTCDEFWNATLCGRSGLAPITRFDASGYPVTVAGEIDGFHAADHVPGRLVPQTDRTTHFAIAAADAALGQAKVDLSALDPLEVGVITANACGGFEFGQHELQKLWAEGPHRVSAYQSFAWFYAVNTGQLSILHGMKGHSSVVVSEQAGGLDALSAARRQLRRGTLRVALAGGVDAPLSPWGLTAQLPNGLLSTCPDPELAYLPFDTRASGYVPGEGGALLVLETEETADGRELGEIAGCAATFDPSVRTGREPALRRAIETALDDAGLHPSDVGAVIADASGVPSRDAEEATALAAVFGSEGVPVTAPKAGTGRLYSGSGPVDVFCALKMISDDVVPPSANVRDVLSGIDLVIGEPRRLAIDSVLVLARGHGGFNAAMVVRSL